LVAEAANLKQPGEPTELPKKPLRAAKAARIARPAGAARAAKQAVRAARAAAFRPSPGKDVQRSGSQWQSQLSRAAEEKGKLLVQSYDCKLSEMDFASDK